jgi:phenylpropionate dioxygenase-like ring-hydroxylating dioxygenase large terminal subunit
MNQNECEPPEMLGIRKARPSPAMKVSRDTLDALVDTKSGTVSRELFVNEDILEQELEMIFARTWLLVAHECQIPKPNDYVVSRMGQDSVIVTRDRQGGIHVLLNSCRHRGMKVCRYDAGNTRAFTCPYHGWSYSIDGALVEVPGQLIGVPGFNDHYHGELDKRAWGLVPCPKVKNYKGTIWACWDPSAPSFEEYLGDMRLYLDACLDHRDGSPGGSEILGGVQKWRMPCNWKFPPENFIGDHYHDISHRSVNLVGIGPSEGKGRRDTFKPNIIMGFPNLGHGVIGHAPCVDEGAYEPQFTRYPEFADYFRDIYERRKKNLGDQPKVQTGAATIFPSMSFHGRQPRTLAVFHPVSATEMEMWRFYLVDKDAPEPVKAAMRAYYLRYSGPGGMTESDDAENWGYATDASKGAIARRYDYNYQMGLGHAKPVPGLKQAVEGGDTTEENARIYYGRWKQLMQGLSWDELMAASRKAEQEAAR